MLTLQRLEYRMFLGGLGELGGVRGLDKFPEDVAGLHHPSMHRTIRLSTTKTTLASMASIIADLSNRDENSELPVLLQTAAATRCVLPLTKLRYLCTELPPPQQVLA